MSDLEREIERRKPEKNENETLLDVYMQLQGEVRKNMDLDKRLWEEAQARKELLESRAEVRGSGDAVSARRRAAAGADAALTDDRSLAAGSANGDLEVERRPKGRPGAFRPR